MRRRRRVSRVSWGFGELREGKGCHLSGPKKGEADDSKGDAAADEYGGHGAEEAGHDARFKIADLGGGGDEHTIDGRDAAAHMVGREKRHEGAANDGDQEIAPRAADRRKTQRDQHGERRARGHRGWKMLSLSCCVLADKHKSQAW